MIENITMFYTNICMYSLIADIFVIIMSYSFIKLIVLSSITELIWPTQFFNKKNSSSVVKFKFRSFVEFFLKIRSFNFKNKKYTLYYL